MNIKKAEEEVNAHKIMKQLLLNLILLCSWASYAQEQKYILLDSLTAHYTVKQYTLDTSPYGIEKTIEIYNIFSKRYGLSENDDYIVLFSVMSDIESKSNWEEIDFEKVKDNLFPMENIFLRTMTKLFDISFAKDTIDIRRVKLIKKMKGKYYVSKLCKVDGFYCMDYPRDMIVSTKNFILNTNQPIKPISVLKEDYKKVMPYHDFPLDKTGMQFHIPKIYENTYLSNIEEKYDDVMYYFYQFCNTGIINELVYIKEKGIVAGAYGDYIYPRGKIDIGKKRNRNKVKNKPINRLLWAEELKKEWAEKEKEKVKGR